MNFDINNIVPEKLFDWCESSEFTEHIMPNAYGGSFYLDLNNGIIYFDLGTL